MNPLTKVTELLKGFLKPAGVKRLNPSRDWLLLLCVGVLAIFVSMVWNAWFFFVALNQDQTPQTPASLPSVDTSAIQKAQTLFEARAVEEERYKSEYRFVDPSH